LLVNDILIISDHVKSRYRKRNNPDKEGNRFTCSRAFTWGGLKKAREQGLGGVLSVPCGQGVSELHRKSAEGALPLHGLRSGGECYSVRGEV